MQQSTVAEVSFDQYRTPTRRERVLDEMNRVVPWAERTAAMEPVYPKAEGPGRRFFPSPHRIAEVRGRRSSAW